MQGPVGYLPLMRLSSPVDLLYSLYGMILSLECFLEHESN